jgi:hypothetical protein
MKAKRKPATKAKRAQDPHAEFHRKLGQAFRDQESDISDLLTMAEIAARGVDRGQERRGNIHGPPCPRHDR